MREQELLDALVKGGTVQIKATEEGYVVWVLYTPYTSRKGKSLFDAAFQVVKYLMESFQAPKEVREALEAYNWQTETPV